MMMNLSGKPCRKFLTVNRSDQYRGNWESLQSQIHKWRRAALDNGDGKHSGIELTEAAALKKRIRELEMENEILSGASQFSGEKVKTLLVYSSRKDELSA